MVNLKNDIARINEFVESVKKNGLGENEETVLVLRNGIVLGAWMTGRHINYGLHDHTRIVLGPWTCDAKVLCDEYIAWYRNYIEEQAEEKYVIDLPGRTSIIYVEDKKAYLLPMEDGFAKMVEPENIIDTIKEQGLEDKKYWL